MSDRDVILGRIREATRDVPREEADAWGPGEDADPASAYIRERTLEPDRLVQLFAERCADYRATVTRCAAEPDAIGTAITDVCARHHAAKLAVPTDLPRGWAPRGVELALDSPPLSTDELDECAGVLTGCVVAIALTGTIVLDAAAGQGRRALTLIPDLHICVVQAEAIVAGVPDALRMLDPSLRAGRPITLISGPSATSDIELKRVEGVHGPRRLEVVLAVRDRLRGEIQLD